MPQQIFRVECEALDAGQGYLLRGKMAVSDGQGGVTWTEINEHYALEADLRTRLGTGFDIWAGQVNSE